MTETSGTDEPAWGPPTAQPPTTQGQPGPSAWPPPPTPPVAPQGRRRRLSIGVVVALVAGLVIGGGGVGLGWLLSGDKTNTAQNDAHNACDIFNGLQLSADSDLATHYRTSAAVVLAEAANAADPRYQQLRDALQGLDQQFNYIGVGNEPAAVNQLNKVVNSVKTACAGA